MENNERIYTANEVVDELLKNVAGGTDETTVECPQCRTVIQTTLQGLIGGMPIICPHCGLRINITESMSREAIEALKKVQEALDQADRERHNNA